MAASATLAVVGQFRCRNPGFERAVPTQTIDMVHSEVRPVLLKERSGHTGSPPGQKGQGTKTRENHAHGPQGARIHRLIRGFAEGVDALTLVLSTMAGYFSHCPLVLIGLTPLLSDPRRSTPCDRNGTDRRAKLHVCLLSADLLCRPVLIVIKTCVTKKVPKPRRIAPPLLHAMPVQVSAEALAYRGIRMLAHADSKVVAGLPQQLFDQARWGATARYGSREPRSKGRFDQLFGEPLEA